jgi:hypothetical protein
MPEVLEDVRRLLPTCLYIETVADFISLDQTTARKWLKRGANEHQRVSRNRRARVRQSEDLYVEFFLTYKKATAEREGCEFLTADDTLVKNLRPHSRSPCRWRRCRDCDRGESTADAVCSLLRVRHFLSQAVTTSRGCF